MARPIKETPILFGEDARRFEKEMREVKTMSKEKRDKIRRQCDAFLSKVTVKI